MVQAEVGVAEDKPEPQSGRQLCRHVPVARASHAHVNLVEQQDVQITEDRVLLEEGHDPVELYAALNIPGDDPEVSTLGMPRRAGVRALGARLVLQGVGQVHQRLGVPPEDRRAQQLATPPDRREGGDLRRSQSWGQGHRAVEDDGGGVLPQALQIHHPRTESLLVSFVLLIISNV